MPTLPTNLGSLPSGSVYTGVAIPKTEETPVQIGSILTADPATVAAPPKNNTNTIIAVSIAALLLIGLGWYLYKKSK